MDFETQPGIEDLPIMPKKTIKIIIQAAIGLIILVSLGYNGYTFLEKAKKQEYQKGLTDGQAQVNAFVINQLQTTGQLMVTINTPEGDKVIVLKPQF